jgi:hypothetical protein
MTKVFCHFKAQTKLIFYVICLQLAPNVTIIFPVHSLQLFGMFQWMVNKKKFKEYVTIEFCVNVIHKLNFDGPIVKGFQYKICVQGQKHGL